MQSHVLNRKYALDKKENVNYKQINRYYLIASLFSFLSAVGGALLFDFLIGVILFLILYSLSFAFVAYLNGRKYTLL